MKLSEIYISNITEASMVYAIVRKSDGVVLQKSGDKRELDKYLLEPRRGYSRATHEIKQIEDPQQAKAEKDPSLAGHTVKETIEFAQDFNALMKGMEEDLSNREKEIEENLRAWFGKGKKGGAGGGGWDRYNTKGERIGKCGDSKKGEGKPKCLSKSRAASLRAKGGKAAIGAAVRKKRREDPNKNRKGKAKNVSNTTRKKKKK